MELSAGLVIIQNNKILLGHPTNGGWFGSYSIPKGHVEEGESILDAAIRETEEEVGLIIDSSEIDPEESGCIEYKDKKGNVYKKLFYFVVEPENEIIINSSRLQKEEIDWCGFLTKEEAEKKIFWRLKSLLEYIK